MYFRSTLHYRFSIYSHSTAHNVITSYLFAGAVGRKTLIVPHSAPKKPPGKTSNDPTLTQTHTHKGSLLRFNLTFAQISASELWVHTKVCSSISRIASHKICDRYVTTHSCTPSSSTPNWAYDISAKGSFYAASRWRLCHLAVPCIAFLSLCQATRQPHCAGAVQKPEHHPSSARSRCCYWMRALASQIHTHTRTGTQSCLHITIVTVRIS